MICATLGATASYDKTGFHDAAQSCNAAILALLWATDNYGVR